MEAPGRHVEIQFAHTDAKTPDTKVPEAQHTGPVCDHYGIHLGKRADAGSPGHLVLTWSLSQL